MVIDVEQQVIPTLVVSHLSILQCLMSYFRNTPVEQCTSIEVPMHTIIKFTPVRGGGWSETHHSMKGMVAVSSESDFSQVSVSNLESLKPIWGDHQATTRMERSPKSTPGLPLSPRSRRAMADQKATTAPNPVNL